MRRKFVTGRHVWITASLLGGAPVFAQEGGVTSRAVTLEDLEDEINELKRRLTLADEAIAGLVKVTPCLKGEVDTLQENSVLDLGDYVSVETATLNGLAGPHVILNGAERLPLLAAD